MNRNSFVHSISDLQEPNDKSKKKEVAIVEGLNSCWRRARQRRARCAFHQIIDLNTPAPPASSVSFPLVVTPPNVEHQHKSPQQLALSSQSHCNMTLQECYSYLNVGTLPPCSLFQNDDIKI